MANSTQGTQTAFDRQPMDVGAPPAYMQDGVNFWSWIRTLLVGNAIRQKLRKLKPRRVLDIGCGFLATNLVQNLDLISEGCGIDFSISPECRRPNLEFIEGAVDETLPAIASGRFDAILFISTLEHLRRPAEALADCHRTLAEGGTLIINVPTWKAKPVLEYLAFRRGKNTSSINDHKMYYSKRDLWPKLIEAGFMPISVRLKYRFFGMVLMAEATK